MNNRKHKFPVAVTFLRRGTHRISRECWGAGSFIALMPQLSLASYNDQTPGQKVNDRTAAWIGKDTPLDVAPYFSHYDGSKNIWTPGYAFTSEDVLADDWIIVDPIDPCEQTVPFTFSLKETDRCYDVRDRMLTVVFEVSVVSTLVHVMTVPVDELETGIDADTALMAMAREAVEPDIMRLMSETA